MTKLSSAAALAALLLAAPALAQGAPPMKGAPVKAAPVKATVEKVDPAAGRVTLDHEAVPNLGMDAMSMVWRADAAGLKGIKAGDKVTFTGERVNGQLTASKITKAK